MPTCISAATWPSTRIGGPPEIKEAQFPMVGFRRSTRVDDYDLTVRRGARHLCDLNWAHLALISPSSRIRNSKVESTRWSAL